MNGRPVGICFQLGWVRREKKRKSRGGEETKFVMEEQDIALTRGFPNRVDVTARAGAST